MAKTSGQGETCRQTGAHCHPRSRITEGSHAYSQDQGYPPTELRSHDVRDGALPNAVAAMRDELVELLQ